MIDALKILQWYL